MRDISKEELFERVRMYFPEPKPTDDQIESAYEEVTKEHPEWRNLYFSLAHAIKQRLSN
jgi:hypothetical protein